MGFTQTYVLCALNSLYLQMHWAISPFHAKSLHKKVYFLASLETPASPTDQMTALPRKGKYSNLLKVLLPTWICLYLFNSFQFSLFYVSTSEKKKIKQKKANVQKGMEEQMRSSTIITSSFHREEFRKSGTQKSRHKNTRSRWLLIDVAHPLNIFPAENSTVK